MRLEELKALIRELPFLAEWPQALALVELVTPQGELSIWEHPARACLAVGGAPPAARPAAAALVCSLVSLHLVDDMLDDEPLGDFRMLGEGRTANLALAFQAAGHRLLAGSEAPAEVRAAVQSSFAELSLATCLGQEWDSRELATEEDYWRVVGMKTPPLFGEAMRIGALLGGAGADTAEELAGVGRLLGRFVQVSDDLADALKRPARADWKRRTNSLPLLFALTTEHEEREGFRELAGRVDDPEALAEAQKILFRSGAVSYCAWRLVELAREARERLAEVALADPRPLEGLLEQYSAPLSRLLREMGDDGPWGEGS